MHIRIPAAIYDAYARVALKVGVPVTAILREVVKIQAPKNLPDA